ncbi:MAG: GntR family transcriptional regulator [Bacteroidales bacterium]|nr:GntR family transcriptional regulator [Bacteroidales bacterium]
MTEAVYISLYKLLKRDILSGKYDDGDLLPSENILASTFNITRTTVRQALASLLKEGYISKHKGKGSVVIRNSRSLGILSVKGLTEAASGEKVTSEMLEPPAFDKWCSNFSFPLDETYLPCIRFKRLRSINEYPVMLEETWFADKELTGFTKTSFINGSFFETLNKNYHIGIIGARQNVKAIEATSEFAALFRVKSKAPLLRIDIKFKTDKDFHLYSRLVCDTRHYQVESSTCTL